MSTLFLHQLEAMFGWILAASWQASVLALLVLLLQWAMGARLNPRWRYALWLLVLVRLVVPALPESAWSLFQFAPPPPVSFVEPVTEPLFAATPLPVSQIEMPAIEPGYPFSFFSVLAIVWLTGASALLLLTWQVNRRFARQIADSPEIVDPELLQLFASTKAELHVTRSIRLIESSQVQSPAIMGLFRSTLLLPADVRDKFDARELRFIFLHELAHLKRGDVFAQAVIAALQIIHWFNPVLWFAFRRMRIDREPATDALVLSRTGESEKESYGLMLIKLLEHFNQRHSLPTLVGILEDRDQFKRRFSLIAKFTRGAYGWSLLGFLLIAILAMVCLTKSKTPVADIAATPDTQQGFARVEVLAMELPESDYQAKRAEIDKVVQQGHYLALQDTPPGIPPARIVYRGYLPVTKWGRPSGFGTGPTHPSLMFECTSTRLEGGTVKLACNLTVNQATWTEHPGKTPSLELSPIGSFPLNGTLTPSSSQFQVIPKEGILSPVSADGQSNKVPYRLFLFFKVWPQQEAPTENTASTGTPAPVPTPATGPVDSSGTALPNGKTMQFGITVVEIDAKQYSMASDAMDQAVKTGNVHFFDNKPGVIVLPSGQLKIAEGKRGWSSIGKVLTYIDWKMDEKSNTLAEAKAVFGGFNADIDWSKGGDSLSASYQLTEPVEYNPPATKIDIPGAPKSVLIPKFEVHTAKDEWKLEPAKTHGVWLGNQETNGELKLFAKNGDPTIDELIKAKSPSRIAIFTTPQTITADSNNAAPATTSSIAANQTETVSSPVPTTTGTMVRLATKVFQISEDDYQAHHDEIDAAVQKGDVAALSGLNLKSLNRIADPFVLVKAGEQGVVEVVRLVPYPIAFGKDSNGQLAGVDFKRARVGTHFVFKPTATDTNISVKGYLYVTSLAGWTPTHDITSQPEFQERTLQISEPFQSGQTKGFQLPGGPQMEPRDPTLVFTADKIPSPTENPKTLARDFLFLSVQLYTLDGKLVTSTINPATAPVTAVAINNDADTNETLSPLFKAIKAKDEAAAMKLIAEGADVTATDKDGDGALVYLMTWWSGFPLNLWEAMLKHTDNPNPDYHFTHTQPATPPVPLLEETIAITGAITLSDEERASYRQAIKMLLDHGAKFSQVADAKAQALLLAATRGDLPAIQQAIQQGASINAANGNGWTPFAISLALRYDDCTNWLLDHGANSFGSIKPWYDPLEFAVRHGQTEIAKKMLAAGAKFTPDDTLLRPAIEQNNQPLFDVLMKAGATGKNSGWGWNETGGHKYRILSSVPVYICIQNNETSMAKTLLDTGAEAEPQNPMDGRNLAYWAVSYNRPEILQTLLAHGANPLLKDRSGESALSLAQKSHPNLVPILEKAAKDTTATPAPGNSSDAPLTNSTSSTNSSVATGPAPETGDNMVHLVAKVVQISEDDYKAHQGEIDETRGKGADALASLNLKSFNQVANLSIVVKAGEQGIVEMVKVLRFPKAFEKDASGQQLESDFRIAKLGTRFVLKPRLTGDKTVIDVQADIGLDSLAGWTPTKDLPPQPDIHRRRLTALMLIPSGHSLGIQMDGGAQMESRDPTLVFTADKIPSPTENPKTLSRDFLFLSVQLYTPDGKPVTSPTSAPANSSDAPQTNSASPTNSTAATAPAPASMSDAEARQKGIAALVNGRPVTWAEVAYGLHSPNPDQKAYAVRRLVDNALIVQDFEASKDRIPADALKRIDAEVQKRTDFALKGFDGDKGAFAENLKKNGLTLEGFVEMNRRQEIVNYMDDVKVYARTEKYLASHHSASWSAEKPLSKEDQATFTEENTRLFNEWMQGLHAKAVIQLFADPDATAQTSPAPGINTNSIASLPAILTIPTPYPVPEPPPTALNKAVTSGNYDQAKALLDHGAIPYENDMAAALSGGHNQIAKLLWDHGPHYCSELTYAISQDEPIDKIEPLVAAEPQMGSAADRFITALQVAAQNGNLAVAQLLVKHGVQLNPTNTLYNPLLSAARGANPEMIDFLVKSGAHSFFLPTLGAIGNGCIVTGYPIKPGTEKIIDTLIQAGTLKGLSEDDAALFLIMAFNSGNPTTLKQLLNAGLSTHSKRDQSDDKGKTAIEIVRESYAKSIALDPTSASRFKPLLDMLEAADKGTAATTSSTPTTQIQVELKVAEIADEVYLANKEKLDADIAKGDWSIIADINNLNGASLLAAPFVTAAPGQKTSVDLTRTMTFPTSPENGKTSTDNSTNLPPTTRDVGVKAEMTPSLKEGKIVLKGTFECTTFQGMTQDSSGARTPTFDTRKIEILEALEKSQLKGIWVPGTRMGERDVPTGDTDSTGKPTYKKKPALMRMIVFVTANQVKPPEPH